MNGKIKAYTEIWCYMDVEIIKKNFSEIRQRKGIKMDDLARDLGVTTQTIYSQMRGNPTLSTLEKLAALLGVDPWELLKPVDDDNNEQKKLPQIICPHCGKAITISVKEN